MNSDDFPPKDEKGKTDSAENEEAAPSEVDMSLIGVYKTQVGESDDNPWSGAGSVDPTDAEKLAPAPPPVPGAPLDIEEEPVAEVAPEEEPAAEDAAGEDTEIALELDVEATDGEDNDALFDAVASELQVSEDGASDSDGSGEESDLEAFLSDGGDEDEFPTIEEAAFDASSLEEESTDEDALLESLNMEMDELGGDGLELDVLPGLDPLTGSSPISSDVPVSMLEPEPQGSSSKSVVLALILGIIVGAGGLFGVVSQGIVSLPGAEKVEKKKKKVVKKTVAGGLKFDKLPKGFSHRGLVYEHKALESDTPDGYKKTIEGLEKKIAKLQSDVEGAENSSKSRLKNELEQELVRVWAMYHERFPMEFTKKSLAGKWKGIRKGALGYSGKEWAPKRSAALVRAFDKASDQNFSQAMIELQNYLTAYPQGGQNDLYLVGRLLYRQGRVKDAAKVFHAALASSPKDVRLNYSLGQTYLLWKVLEDSQQIDPPEKPALELAKTHLDKATKANPDHHFSTLATAKLALMQDDRDSALELTNKIMKDEKGESKKLDRSTSYAANTILAEIYRKQSQVEKELKALEVAMEIQESEELIVRIAQIYLRGRPGANADEENRKTGEYLSKCSGGKSDDPPKCSSPAYYRVKIQHLAKNDTDQHSSLLLEQMIEKARAAYPSDLEIQLLAGTMWMDKKDNDRALQVYREALKRAPKRPEAYLAIADLHLASKTNQGKISAAKILDQGIQNVTKTVPLWEKKLEIASGQPEQQIQILNTLIKLDSSRPVAEQDALFRMKLGVVYRDLDRTDEALAQFDRVPVVKLSGDYLKVYISLLLGASTTASGESGLAKAENLAATYITNNNKDPLAHILMGEVLVHKGELAKAENHLKRATEFAKIEDPRIYDLRATIAKENGTLDIAEEFLKSAVDKAVEQKCEGAQCASRDIYAVKLRIKRAETLIDLFRASKKTNPTDAKQKSTEALSVLDNVIESVSKKKSNAIPVTDEVVAKAHLLRGNLYYASSEMRMAHADFKQALALDKFNTDIKISYATSLIQSKRIREAKTLLNSVVKKDRFHALANYQLARIAERQNDRKARFAHLSRAVKSGGSEIPEAHRELADLYWLKNTKENKEQAKKHYRQYLDQYQKANSTRPSDADEVERKLR